MRRTLAKRLLLGSLLVILTMIVKLSSKGLVSIYQFFLNYKYQPLLIQDVELSVSRLTVITDSGAVTIATNVVSLIALVGIAIVLIALVIWPENHKES